MRRWRRWPRFGHPRKSPFWGDERGLETLEAILVLPVVLVLFLMVVNFGWAYFVAQTCQEAARHGARMGATASDPGAAAHAAAAEFAAHIPASSIAVEAPGGVLTPGGTLRVTVRGRVPLFVPGLAGSLDVQGQSTARMEGW